MIPRASSLVFILVLGGCGLFWPSADPRMCMGHTGTPEEQVRACDEWLRHTSRDNPRARAVILTSRAEAKERGGEREAALHDFDAALELWEDAPTALLGAGRVHLAQGDYSGAEPYLRRSIHVHDSGIAADMFGAHFLQQGDNASALREYDALLARQPDNANGLYGRGVARIRTGDEAGREDIARARTLYDRIDRDFEERGIAAP